MEVHAHTHTARKKWTHYLWEFLMLFLAVFCGFLAENYREHFIEHKREKKYMAYLLTDLRRDSIRLNSDAGSIRVLNKGLDTLIHALRQPLSDDKNLALVYIMYLKYGIVGVAVSFNENTMSQLKTGGGLRLIRKDNVLEKINQYEHIKERVLKQSASLWNLLLKIENDHANYLFDFTGPSPILDLLETGDFSSNTDSMMKLAVHDQLILLTKDPARIAVFRNEIRSSKSMFEYYLVEINRAILINSTLASGIKKEYHLK